MADAGAMDGIRRELHAGHRALENLGDSVPDGPDAGAATPELTEALAHLVAAAGQYSTGLALAGDAVHDAQRDYVAMNEATARMFAELS
jgi:hypothetical protein